MAPRITDIPIFDWLCLTLQPEQLRDPDSAGRRKGASPRSPLAVSASFSTLRNHPGSRRQSATESARSRGVPRVHAACIVAGSFIDAALLRFRSPSAVLLTCACVKFLVTASFLFNRVMVQHRLDIEGGVAAISGTAAPVTGAASSKVTPMEILWGDLLAKVANSMQRQLGDIEGGMDDNRKRVVDTL